MNTVLCMQDPDTYGLPDTDEEIIRHDKLAQVTKDNTFVGNNKTKVYHDQECYCVDMISPENLEAINDDFTDRKGRHYHACGKCLASYTSIRDYVDKLETDRQSLLFEENEDGDDL